QKLLDLYLADDVSMATVRPRLAELRQHRASVTERLERARASAAAVGADVDQEDAIQRACARALRGIDKLDAAGRQALLATLLDEVVIRGRAIEVHGI